MNQVQFLEDLVDAYSPEELAKLCMRLGVNYDTLDGTNLRGKVLSLIGYMARRGRSQALLQTVLAERPHLATKYDPDTPPAPDPPAVVEEEDTLSWLERVAGGEGPAIDEPLTFDWEAESEQYVDPARRDEILADDVPIIEEPPTTTWPEDAPPPSGPPPGNPYNAGPMVTDPAMFFGRQEELRRLRARLANMGSSSIVGLRRIGKSSLLYHLSHHQSFPPEQRFLVAYLDLQDVGYHTLVNLLNGAVKRWASQISDVPVPNVVDLHEFSELVRALRQKGFRPLLFLDEFENLLKRPSEFDDDLFESWRALGNAGNVTFITASKQPLATLLKDQDYTSNFYNIFHQVDLGLLEETAARALLTAPPAARGVAVPPDAVAALLALCGSHPFYLQMAAFHLYDGLVNGRYAPQEIEEQFTWLAEPHWRGLWQSLSPAQQTVTAALARAGAPATVDDDPVMARHCRALARRGVLVKAGAEYRPFSRGFARWVATVAAAPPRQEREAPPTLLDKLRGLWGKEDKS